MPRVTAALLAALAIFALVLTGSAVVSTGSVAAVDAKSVAPEENNTTVQHENPDIVNENGNQDDIQQWLEGRMGGRLQQSTLQISQGDYEAAQSVLGNQYNEYLDKYVDVAGDPEGQNDETTAEAFNETQSEQQEYVTLLEEYRETYQAYQAAKEAGNETRKRELARKLVRLADQISGTSTDLTNAYETLENETGTNVSTSTTQIESSTANVTTQQQTVIDAEFVRTRLEIVNVSPAGSYTDPIQIHGVLQANESLPEHIVLRVAGETQTVAVAEDGEFTVSYRPLSERTGQQTLSIAYRPESTTLFLGSSTTAKTQIVAVEPTLSVTANQTTTQYRDRVSVQGHVTVNETGVAGVAIDLSLNGYPLQTVRTNATGGYATTVVVPAAVTEGAANMTATVGFQDRAIASTSALTHITVQETATALSATATLNETETQVSGRLTAAGTGVADQHVRVLQNGTELTTATTDETGRYGVSIPQSVATGDTELQVVFTGENANLARATAQTRIPVPDTGSSGLPMYLFAGIGGVLLVGVGGVAVWYRRRQTHSAYTTASDSRADTPQPTQSQEHTATSERAQPTLENVLLPDGVGSATEARNAYAGVRQAVGPFLSSDDVSRTHWEFAHTVRAELEPSVGDAVAELARVYEQAAYAEVVVSDEEFETASAALETITGWLEEREAFTAESPRNQVND